MIRSIFKQLWNQRRSNLWLFIELLLVGIFVWYVADYFLVNIYTYVQSKGFDTSHTYQIRISELPADNKHYIPSEEKETDDTYDLLQLMQRIGQVDGVENACISFFSCFYSSGNSRTYLRFTDDEEKMEFHVRRVTPEFFDVFRVYQKSKIPVDPGQLTASSILLSSDLEEMLFSGDQATGKTILMGYREQLPYQIAGVTTPIRNTEYEKAEPCLFEIMTGPSLVSHVKSFGVTRCELFIRVAPEADRDYINRFTDQMGERLTFNNLYVSGIIPIEELRNNKLKRYRDEESVRLSLILFVLLNVFFGIVATFWLRTGYRKGEIGLRKALGANRSAIVSQFYLESLFLLLLALPFIVFVGVNLVAMEYVDTYRLPFTICRFLADLLLTFLLIGGMIVLGVSYPAQKAATVEPAEALHNE